MDVCVFGSWMSAQRFSFSLVFEDLTEVLNLNVRPRDPRCPRDVHPDNFLLGLLLLPETYVGTLNLGRMCDVHVEFKSIDLKLEKDNAPKLERGCSSFFHNAGVFKRKCACLGQSSHFLRAALPLAPSAVRTEKV